MGEKDFLVRRFDKSDVDGIVELFQKVFEGNFTREWWEWKYMLNPAGFHGQEGDIWIAQASNGEIVGHWAVIPERMKVGANTVIVAQAVDAATHPCYRGRGIFKTLVSNVCSDARKRYSFVFGFPNELYKGYQKLGWKSFPMIEFLNFVTYDQPLKDYFKSKITIQFAKTALKMLQARNYFSISSHSEKLSGGEVEIEEVEMFPTEMDDFWEIVKSEHDIVIERDSSFLNWRFSKHFGDDQKLVARSTKTAKITGYAVIKKTNIRGITGILEIVDLHALPLEDKSLVELIQFVINMAERGKLNVIYTRVPPWHKYSKLLRKLKFVPIGGIFEHVGLYQPRLITYPLAQDTTPDINKWFFTLADTDYA
jgi:hypothetical protein